MKIIINLEDPCFDSNIQNLIKAIADKWFDGDIKETLDYFNVMSQCIETTDKSFNKEVFK